MEEMGVFLSYKNRRRVCVCGHLEGEHVGGCEFSWSHPAGLEGCACVGFEDSGVKYFVRGGNSGKGEEECEAKEASCKEGEEGCKEEKGL